MNRLVTALLSLTLASLVACTDDTPEKEPEAVEPETPVADEAPVEQSERPKRTMKEVMDAVTQSVKDSKEAETGDTLCERAYSGQIAMSENLMKALGSEEPPPKVDRDAFIEICESADPEVQQCLVPSYALDHRQECRAIKDKAGPEFAARLKALSKKRGGAADEAAEPEAKP
jgi:hypothetical protein